MSGVNLKSYDVRVACEFALTNCREERDALRETIKHKMIGEVMSAKKLWFWQKKPTYEQAREYAERLFDEMKVDVTGPAFKEIDDRIAEFERLRQAAAYVGDNVTMIVDTYDLEMLGPNLRGF